MKKKQNTFISPLTLYWKKAKWVWTSR
jgi:hypothetical protein